MNTNPNQQTNFPAILTQLPKPMLRGLVHCAAFILTCIGFLLFLLTSWFYQFNLGIFIYLISQMLQFGVSSFYHIPDWSPKTKRFLRYLDHSCIFLFISATQTAIILNTIPKNEIQFALAPIKLSWGMSLLGILRFFVVKKLYDIFDLIWYICHGFSVVPFTRILFYFDSFELTLLLLGGGLYIIGGIVYGMEWPNPLPKVIGYHEIFHMFTLLGNACFGVVVTRDYVSSMFSKKSS